ncbi:putative metal-dependent peptidase [Arthrobacter sp. SORGH_AS 212]|uniref:ImmA/IrrE family metallo-endopeptidase n=1 Tax=Pseudarthrobacter sp. SORGH_AS 212 TaxID=3041777 RepID=UPI002787CCD3|nr:putative metal-dependent peptidase [Arthrobacter sp. SORGH_AS_0212]
MDLGDRLAEQMGVRIVTHRLPGFLVAATDGRTIYLDDRLTHRERRCAIYHELVHIELGHRECQPPAIEKKVRAAAAARLVSWEAVWEHAPWAHSLEELAEDVMVTKSVLSDWITALPIEAREHLQRRFECAA